MLEKKREKREAIEEFQAKMQRTYTVPAPQTPTAELDTSYHRDEEEVEEMVIAAKKLIVDRVPHVD